MQKKAVLTVDEALQQGISSHKQGNLQMASQLYRAILQVESAHPDANHNMGVLAVQLKQPAAGLPHFKTALEANRNQVQYWVSYLDALIRAGETEAARQVLAQARQQGMQEARLGPATEGILVALYAEGRYTEALQFAQRMTENLPQQGFGWKALGTILNELGRNSDALTAMQQAAELMPEDAETHSNLGNILRVLGQLDDATISYRRAVEINPDFAVVHCHLGVIMQELGQFDDAVASYRRALEIKPDFALVHNNLGVTLQELGQFDNAVACYERALFLKPDLAEAHASLGNALRDLGNIQEAALSYQRALEFKPGLIKVHSVLLFANNFLANQSARVLLSEARQYGEMLSKLSPPFLDWPNESDPDRLLRIGMVSGDLRNHSVGHFVDGVIRSLSRSSYGRLELIAYSNNSRLDAVSNRIKASCHGWHTVVGLSDADLAKRIRDDDIDILIDLSGHTAYNRLPMFALKPAPVQVSWLGYFATTGVQAMDYLIADPWTVPEAEEFHFTEKICRLPETYLCFTPPDIDVQVGALPVLSKGYITFGCFNNLTKMNDSVVALWARVLNAVPGSRLFLKAKQLGEATVCQSVISRFAIHGIDRERLILEGGAPRSELLVAYRRVDIALDPFPYPGGTTSIESLWMGVPVLTLSGDRFLSHIGESILQNAGLPEYIAADQNSYVALAVLHAGDLSRLEILRSGLRQQVLDSPLFDAPRFAHHFEAALRGMWVQWCNQQQGKIL